MSASSSFFSPVSSSTTSKKRKSSWALLPTTKENEDCLHDVIFARGHGVTKNPGNIKYRELISEHVVAYKKTQNQQRKNMIAQLVVSSIQSSGGKFYKYVLVDHCSHEGDPEDTNEDEKINVAATSTIAVGVKKRQSSFSSLPRTPGVRGDDGNNSRWKKQMMHSRHEILKKVKQSLRDYNKEKHLQRNEGSRTTRRRNKSKLLTLKRSLSLSSYDSESSSIATSQPPTKTRRRQRRRGSVNSTSSSSKMIEETSSCSSSYSFSCSSNILEDIISFSCSSNILEDIIGPPYFHEEEPQQGTRAQQSRRQLQLMLQQQGKEEAEENDDEEGDTTTHHQQHQQYDATRTTQHRTPLNNNTLFLLPSCSTPPGGSASEVLPPQVPQQTAAQECKVAILAPALPEEGGQQQQPQGEQQQRFGDHCHFIAYLDNSGDHHVELSSSAAPPPIIFPIEDDIKLYEEWVSETRTSKAYGLDSSSWIISETFFDDNKKFSSW